MDRHDIIVIGASAGGVEALKELVRGLPANLRAAVFIVLHLPAQSPSILPEILSGASSLRAMHAVDRDEIEYGRIYVAPPDFHLLIASGCVRVARGPKENRARPAVDPLFRSAANVYGSRVIGVVLTGALDDGTAGLLAIKQKGGVAMVQDPRDAVSPSMPQNALENVEVDYCLPLVNIPSALVRLVGESAQPENRRLPPPPPGSAAIETAITEAVMTDMEKIDVVGKPSAYSCPECNGTLWEIQDGELLRFRCRVGHGYSPENLIAEQFEALESSLWAAVRALEERASLLRHLAEQSRARHHNAIFTRYQERVQEAEHNAAVLRELLLKNGPVGGEAQALS